ncbi:MAG: class II aldolase/adducin family protein [Ignavibacteriales bacterium]|nr:class II aldolase/adducin family protein [Ignavibacteriales bacterium]
MSDRADIAQAIIEVCRKVEQKGFVAATDGNISARLPNGNIIATPTSLNKGIVEIDDLVEVTIDGKQVSGKKKPSTEMLMHLFIYKHRTDVQSVVHCHPVHATGFAAARVSLKQNAFPEVIVQFGEIPLAEYATPSTHALGKSLEPFIKDHDAVLLANHGVVTYGNDPWDAYFKMEKVEQIAHMQFVATVLGGAKQLSADQVTELKELAKTVYKKE